jgi:uncharacterized protein (DUF427 family)
VINKPTYLSLHWYQQERRKEREKRRRRKSKMVTTGHATATANGTIIAETDQWEVVEGNVYFPPSSLKIDFFTGPTNLHTHCPWKGDASYYTITVDGMYKE